MIIGYYDNLKAYKFYNPKNRKIIMSRDVIFDEGGEYSDKKLQEKLFKEESLEEKISTKEHPIHVVT